MSGKDTRIVKRYGKVKERWTAETLKYKLPEGKRVMDCVPPAFVSDKDYDPLYSSFSKNF